MAVLAVSYETLTSRATKPIGYARVSTRQQPTDPQTADILAAGCRRDELCVD